MRPRHRRIPDGIDDAAKVTAGQQIGLVADAFGDDATPLEATEEGLIIGHTNNPLVQQGDAIVHLATMAAEGSAGLIPQVEAEGRPPVEF